jgi:hypothetical protein
MSSERAPRARRPTPTEISAGEALALARERFPNLTAAGILGAKQSGQPIDPVHVTRALALLSQCRKTRTANCHSFDLRAAVGGVSVGAVIAAAVGLDFAVCSWSGVTDYMPHALIGVDQLDVARCGRSIAVD